MSYGGSSVSISDGMANVREKCHGIGVCESMSWMFSHVNNRLTFLGGVVVVLLVISIAVIIWNMIVYIINVVMVNMASMSFAMVIFTACTFLYRFKFWSII